MKLSSDVQNQNMYTNVTLPNVERAFSLLGSQALQYVAWPFIYLFLFAGHLGCLPLILSELAGRPAGRISQSANITH